MQETRLENSRGLVWPPKTKSLSEGTLSMLMAMWFHSLVGSLGHTIGFSSSGLYASGRTHSFFT